MDSAFCGAPAVWAARRAGPRFSVTVRMDPKVRAAIAAIPEDAWTPIRYPRAIWDDQLRCWVSDAQVAEADCAEGRREHVARDTEPVSPRTVLSRLIYQAFAHIENDRTDHIRHSMGPPRPGPTT